MVTLANSNGNDYSGATSITGGTLVLASSNAVHNSSVALNANNGLAFSPGAGTFVLGSLSGSGALALSDTAGGAVALSVGGNGQTSTFTGAMSGAGGLTKNGGGLLSLANSAISYIGNTTVTGGTLQFYNARNFSNGNYPGNTFNIAAGSVLEFYADNSYTTTDNANELLGTWQGGGSVFSGNGTFRKTGNGVLASGQGQNGTYMTFALSNSGLIDIEGGTLRNGGWQNTTWTNNQAPMYIASGATLDVWDGNPVYIDALNGAGTITKQQGNGGNVTLNVGVAGGSGTFSGVIQNPNTNISLVKAGGWAASPVGQQHLLRRDDHQRRHAPTRRRRRKRFHQLDELDYQQRHARIQPVRCQLGDGVHQRQRKSRQGRAGHHHTDQGEQLYGRHLDHRRRLAASGADTGCCWRGHAFDLVRSEQSGQWNDWLADRGRGRPKREPRHRRDH